MFQVFDNGKPADCWNQKSLGDGENGWTTSAFDTLDDAQEYATRYLGIYNPGRSLEVGEKYDYSGYGDILEIREV